MTRLRAILSIALLLALVLRPAAVLGEAVRVEQARIAPVVERFVEQLQRILHRPATHQRSR